MRSLRALLLLGLLCVAAGVAASAAGEAAREGPPRVVALNPSLTAILLALGAEDSLVGVDDYSARLRPELAGLPRVGGLFNPSLEAIVALEPDLVALVPSAEQRSLRDRLVALDIEVLALADITLGELLASIETLGARVGRAEAARERVRAIRRAWTEVERASQRRRPRPRTVLVIQRDPLYLVGGGSYIGEMLRAAGAENAAARFDEPYPRVGLEWLIAAQPQLILDATEDPEPAADYWSRWPSLPAVANGRVRAISPQLTLPGPDLDRVIYRLAEAIHGEGWRSAATAPHP